MSSINAADAHRSTRCAAQTSAVFSETRYAMNGDLHVAYRTAGAGARDIVFVPNWFTNCEVFPELPSLRGLSDRAAAVAEAMRRRLLE